MANAPRGPARRMADAMLAGVVVLMVGMMIIPLPTPLLDVLIATNVSVAVLMLLVAMYMRGGLSLTSFPAVLLVTTLYRLALNVSTTRLILLQADAGRVIDAFGEFVVAGNYVVGAVVFLILTLIQFLVIAKGSERVAEVGARFALDAMPGKQMSIDAELRSGAITREEARDKRALLQRESELYGSMDGAMKFVKGDAIAGIVITVINILGGLSIGVLMRDMSAGDALKTYGLLTIGDGLVSQIPALLISTSAGMVVTRVASDDDDGSLGTQVATQIFGNPRALGVAAVFLVVLALVPGLPAVPFLLLGAVFGATSRRLRRDRPASDAEAAPALRERERELEARRARTPLLQPVAVSVGEQLAGDALGDGDEGPLLSREVPRLRQGLFDELGVAVPAVHVRRTGESAPDGYTLWVQEIPVGRGRVPEGRQADIEAIDGAQLIARHLHAALRRHAHELVGMQEVQTMLDQLEQTHPALIRNVVPKPVSLTRLTDVLRRLVRERVSIRPLREILEALASHAGTDTDAEALTERVRRALHRHITYRYARDGALQVYLLDPAIEDGVRDSIQRSGAGSHLAMPPDLARDVVEAVRRQCASGGQGDAIVLTQGDVRRFVRELIDVELPDVVVLAYEELAPEIRVEPLGRVSL